ncbi:AsnC family transcriptional regulator, partial [Streptomyces sp. NPDC057696]|uniref:Lrp/AsnC family transcriptional regulator n=1 Tax=Streptomyces sp. NPDC057696 TaxID=3346218 RepID=UPI0036B68E3B
MTEDASATRRVVTASVAGNMLEWYDFFLYTTAAAMVLGSVFFPSEGHRDSSATRRDVPPMSVQDYAGPVSGREFGDLDELDRGVVHALQIHPRALWTLIGEVLGVDPVTVARRWHRLEAAGLAGVTAYPRLTDARIVVTGLVEVDTEPGVAEDVARALAEDPAVPNIKLTAGGRDIVAAVQTRSLDELSRLLCPEHEMELVVGKASISGAVRKMKVLWPFGAALRGE